MWQGMECISVNYQHYINWEGDGDIADIAEGLWSNLMFFSGWVNMSNLMHSTSIELRVGLRHTGLQGCSVACWLSQTNLQEDSIMLE